MPDHPGYPTHLFIEIILSEGALFMGLQKIEGVNIEFYMGSSGRTIQICIADEYISVTAAKIYLDQLGYHSLIDRLFPSED